MIAKSPQAAEWHAMHKDDRQICSVCGVPVGLLTSRKQQHRAATPEDDPNVLWVRRSKSNSGWREKPIARKNPSGDSSARSDRRKTVPRQQTVDVLASAAAMLVRGSTLDEAAAAIGIKSGDQLFPDPGDLTLLTFFESYYEPVRLADTAPTTPKRYKEILRRWAAITGDPPLKDITVGLLARYRDCLKQSPGQRGERMSANTIRTHLRHIQAILDKAGPSGPRHRDAADLLEKVPWIKPPRQEHMQPKAAKLEHIGDLYSAAVAMDRPHVEGITAAAWWRALLVVALNTGLRRGTLFQLRMSHVKWSNKQLVIPPQRLKTARGQTLPLNPITLQHLEAIRTERQLVFPWHNGMECFHKTFHRLQDVAGIPEEEQFGLHGIRKRAATLLCEHSLQAAQLLLGHTTARTTVAHYIDPDQIVAKALQDLPQPKAFKQSQG